MKGVSVNLRQAPTGPKVHSFDTPRDMYYGVIDLFLMEGDYADNRHGLHVSSYDNYLICQRPELIHEETVDGGVSLAEVGFTPRRWKTFLSHYCDPVDLSTWWWSVKTGNYSQEVGMMAQRHPTHRLGNCFYGVTTRVDPYVVQLISRSTVWAPTGALDLTWGCLLAKKIYDELGNKPVTFIWSASRVTAYVVKWLPPLEYAGILKNVIDGYYPDTLATVHTRNHFNDLARTINSPYRTFYTAEQRRQKVIALKSGIDTGGPGRYKVEIPEDWWDWVVNPAGLTKVGSPWYECSVGAWAAQHMVTPDHKTWKTMWDRMMKSGVQTLFNRGKDEGRLRQMNDRDGNLILDFREERVKRWAFEARELSRGPGGVGG